MKLYVGKKSWMIFSVVLGLFLIFTLTTAIGADIGEKLLEKFKEFEPVEPLLPPDVKIQTEFVAGEGAAVGNIQKIQGNAYVIHKNKKVAYLLKNDLPLFTGDTLITAARARINAVMNDQSVMALAPNSKLVIDQSVYDPKKEERSSVMGVLFGQARFIVKKIMGQPSFSVKTPTAVCGVRGSDFAISVGPATEELSSIQKFFKKFSLVPEAHALVPGAMVTVVVTGQGTTVTFVGSIGALQTVAPLSVCAAVTGSAAIAPAVVGAAAAATLTAVGPGLVALSMPPHFD